MTLSLKGFITNSALANNTPGVLARFGELSTHCRTFASDVQTLAGTSYPGLEVAVFSHHTTTSDVQIKVTNIYADRLLEISAWLHDMSTSFNSSTKQLDVVAALVNVFGDYVTNAGADKVEGADGHYLPTRVSFTLTVPGFSAVEVVLWTSNSEFETGYDESAIVVVPPTDNIDVFLANYAAVLEQLSVVNPVRDMQRIEAAAQKKPPTHTVATTISWVDPTQPGRKVSTTWYALIYGSRGNTTDAINGALREYILSRTTSNESSWRLLMPDLFRVTRFLVIPLWEEISIPGRTSIAGIYSPVVSLQTCAAAVQTVTEDIGINRSDFEVFSHPFRSLTLLMLAGDDNREDALLLRQAVPDYIACESTHEDFNRQALSTQDFSNMLGSLIRACESYHSGSAQATGVRVVVFDTYTCLAAKHNNVEFIMRVKRQA